MSDMLFLHDLFVSSFPFHASRATIRCKDVPYRSWACTQFIDFHVSREKNDDASHAGLLNLVWRVSRDTCLYGVDYIGERVGGGGSTQVC